jgi:prolipoprotein diacylglyceryltransferase
VCDVLIETAREREREKEGYIISEAALYYGQNRLKGIEKMRATDTQSTGLLNGYYSQSFCPSFSS